LQYHMQY